MLFLGCLVLVLRAKLWHFLKMVRIRPLLSSVMALALVSSPAIAAGDVAPPVVKVRGSDKSDYSRLVFDWGGSGAGAAPTYTTQQTPTRLIITFAKAGQFTAEGAGANGISRLTGYNILSPNTVAIDFPAGQTLRHFTMGNRLVIDIKGNAKKPSATEKGAEKPAKVAETKSFANPVKTDPVKKDPVKGDPVNLAAHIETAAGEPTKTESAKTAAVKTPEVSAPSAAHNLEKQIAKINNPHVVMDSPPPTGEAASSSVAAAPTEEKVPVKPTEIMITSTSSIPLAVFERNGYLWVVEGKPDVKIPPTVTNPALLNGKQFESVPVESASAFRLQLPEGVSLKGAGKGLAWKVSLLPDGESGEGSGAGVSTHVPLQRVFPEKASAPPYMMWPATTLNRILGLTDPESGDEISVGLVEDAKDQSGLRQSYVDFDVLPSYIGIALVPKADDLKVSKSEDGVIVSRPEGLHISSDQDVLNAPPPKNPAQTLAKQGNITRVYDFQNWRLGTPQDLPDNQRLIMLAMKDQTDTRKAESLINLGHLMLSFDYAPESYGYLDLAQNLVPELENNPEFIALRGASQALSWNYKDAYQTFSSASLNDIGEIAYWKAYTLAKLEDWQQAAKTLPDDIGILSTYPDEIQQPLALTFAEIALRQGNKEKAKSILDMIEPAREHMPTPYASAFDYLTGEYARQTGKPEISKEKWKELAQGPDDLYRAKARFALTMLQLASKEITPDKAIDNLEGLRYAWRGDELEVSINSNLAKVYLDQGDPVKALTLMRVARDLNPTSEQGKQIDADMRATFKKLFDPQKIKTISPVDVLTVYNEFSDLLPAGADGEALTRQLAERMADADLLPRATSLLKKQVDDGGVQGLEGAGVAIRLAALQNMDGRADDALQSLAKAEGLLKGLPAEDVLPKQRDIGMLRAKALSMKGKPDDAFAALALLPQDEDTLRLRADIAWRGKKWQDAADSLEQVIQKQDISLTRPLTDAQADMLLNWAVALYLADNRYVLANLRERYSDAMAATPKAKKFEVVTRPRQASLLSDRETINSIIDETTIFKDFLQSFKTPDVARAPSVSSGASPTTATPAVVPDALKNAPSVKVDDVLAD